MLSKFMSENHFSEYEEFFLSNGCGVQKKKKGEVFFNIHSRNNNTAYYIKSGVAKFSILNEEGNENIIFFLGKGSIYPINYESYTFAMEKNLYLTSLTDIEIIPFNTNLLEQIFDEDRHFAKLFVQHAHFYVSTLYTKVLLSSYNSSLISVCTFLKLYHCDTSFSSLGILTQNDISQILGISRKQLVRILTGLRNDGIIRTSRNDIEVVDYDKLEAYCSNIISDDMD